MIYRRIQNAIDYAEANLESDVDFREAAAEAYMSIATFYRTFEIFVGMTFMEYVRRRRLADTLPRLKQGEPVARVACDACYSDFNAFSRAFKREFGLSPSSYARSALTVAGLPPARLMEELFVRYEPRFPIKERRMVMENAKEKLVLHDVKKVGFLQNRSDSLYAPESFAFPACFASAVRAISGQSHQKRAHAHDREWIFDLDYHEAMAASGLAFGNLWTKNYQVCMSVNDFTQTAPRQEIFTRTFAWFGHEMRYYAKRGTESEQHFFKELIVDSIEAGKPVLASNLVHAPEFGLVTGYDTKGDVLLGWSHFQGEPGACDGFEKTGEYRVSGWYDKVWELILFGDKVRDHKDPYLLLQWALDMLEGRNPCEDGFFSGLEAYDAWSESLAYDRLFKTDEAALKQVLAMHSSYAGQLAESRAWAQSFFTSILVTMLPEHRAEVEQAGDSCLAIHDLMWEVWGALGGGPATCRYGLASVRNRYAGRPSRSWPKRNSTMSTSSASSSEYSPIGLLVILGA
jgi:AraC-like DNA-binding protein